MTGQVNVNDYITLDNKFRLERAVLNYVGTQPETPNVSDPNPANWTVTDNPTSRYQVTNVIDDQTDATIKFDTGPVRNTVVTGTEFSNEHISIDKYTGLSSGSRRCRSVYIEWQPCRPAFRAAQSHAFFASADTGRQPDRYSRRHRKRLCPRNRKLQRLHHRQRRGVRYDDYHISATNRNTTTNLPQSVSENTWLLVTIMLVRRRRPNASVYAAYATFKRSRGLESGRNVSQLRRLESRGDGQSNFSGRKQAKRPRSASNGNFSVAGCSPPPLCSTPRSRTLVKRYRPAWRMPDRSWLAPPIAFRASTSASPASLRIAGASTADWC